MEKKLELVPYVEHIAKLAEEKAQSEMGPIALQDTRFIIDTSVEFGRYTIRGCDPAYFLDDVKKIAAKLALTPEIYNEFIAFAEFISGSECAQNETFSVVGAKGDHASQMLTCVGGMNDGAVDLVIHAGTLKVKVAPKIVLRHSQIGFFGASTWQNIIEQPAAITNKQVFGIFSHFCNMMLKSIKPN